SGAAAPARAENAQLNSKDKGGLSSKVSEKAGYPCTAWAAFQSSSTKSNGSASWRAQRRSGLAGTKLDQRR
ncbi:MAG TPA: hypothetical protein VIY29_21455, partial [Ktedonobacteraceae bacterium]